MEHLSDEWVNIYFEHAGNILDMYDNLALDEKEEVPEPLKKAIEKLLQHTDDY